MSDTQIMVFDLKSISAEGRASYGAPLTLTLRSRTGTIELTVYTDDQDLTDRLEVAINNAVVNSAPAACQLEAAAYTAAAYAYNEGAR